MSFFTLTSPYRGRFAPTPSGPLHSGSLLTALASWLDARHAGGRWLLRIDDLDRARCTPDAEALILRQLEAHGLGWDETPRRQTIHVDEYRAALDRLDALDIVYRCSCTRAQLINESHLGPDGPVYSGRCRSQPPRGDRVSLRLRVPEAQPTLDDALFGRMKRDAVREIGDFVLLRSDGIIGYHLACVVDEAAQGISHVVRGADLIGASLTQRLLQTLLELPSPAYAHIPVLTDPAGRKLSKQNHAKPLDLRHTGDNLYQALVQLGQKPPSPLAGAAAEELLVWALPNWDALRIPRHLALRAD